MMARWNIGRTYNDMANEAGTSSERGIIKISVLLVFAFAVLTSCDCLQHVQGVVIDSETQLPIHNVKVMRDVDRVVYTDSVGNFEFTSITGGLFGCPKISLSFEKEGYNKATKKYKSCCVDNAVVILEKQIK